MIRIMQMQWGKGKWTNALQKVLIWHPALEHLKQLQNYANIV